MIIRIGFVSNSSSSNFIVAFPKIPTSADEVKALLFPDGQESYGYFERAYPADKVANTVWADMRRQKPNDKDEIWEAAHGYLEGEPNIPYDHTLDKDAQRKARNEEKKACCKYRQKVLKELHEQAPDSYVYCFRYGDDDGSYYGALEHGGLFDALPHIVSSQH